MTRRRRAPTAPPHVRIQDHFYWLLAHLTPPEAKLYFAFRLQAWRADGRRKGYISKSLRKISKEIDLAWTSAQRAMKGLERKGFVVWKPSGIYLPEPEKLPDPPLFSHEFRTRFNTEAPRKIPSETKTQVVHSGPGVVQIGTKVVQIGTNLVHSGPPTPNIHLKNQQVTRARNDHRYDLEKRYTERRASRPLEGVECARSNLIEGGNRGTRDGKHPLSQSEIKQYLDELRQITSAPAPPAVRSDAERDRYEEERRAELRRQAEQLNEGRDDVRSDDPSA